MALYKVETGNKTIIIDAPSRSAAMTWFQRQVKDMGDYLTVQVAPIEPIAVVNGEGIEI